MASSKDFVANQIRTAKVVMTGSQPGDGGIGVGNIGLSIYDQSKALNNEGGVNDAGMYTNIGSEVAILVSGSSNYRGRSKDNTHVLFRGNLGTSGSMHFMNPATPVSASVTLTFTNSPSATETIQFIAADASSATFTCTAGTTSATQFSRGGVKHGADNLKTAIEASAIASKVSVSSVAGSDPFTLTVTQVTAGAAGNTSIASNLSNVSVGGSPAASAGAFNGGSGLENSPQQAFIFADHDRLNHLYLSGNLYAGGDRNNASPYGTISGSIHHTRDGLPYLVGAGGISISSASNGQVTISGSAGGGGGGDVSLNYYDEFNGTPTRTPFAAGNDSVVIGDGVFVDATSQDSLVFGLNNTGSSVRASVIGGGETNFILSVGNSGYARGIVISGGSSNIVTGSSNYSVIGGGRLNIITGSTLTDDNAESNTIAGGAGNTISGSFNTIAGGSFNVITSAGATIAGGTENIINKVGGGAAGFIGAGYGNTGSSDYATIAGGENNSIGQNSDFSFIGSGQKNKTVGNSGVNNAHYATIPGGQGNEIIAGDGQQAPNSTIGGGQYNKIQGADSSVIGGGQHNLIQNNHDKTILLGQHLTSSAANQTILGYGSAFASGYVVASGSFFKSDGLNGGAITGSITRTKENLPYLVAAGSVSISTGSNGQITISGSAGGGGGGGNIVQTSTYSEEGGYRFANNNNIGHMNEQMHNPTITATSGTQAIGAFLNLHHGTEAKLGGTIVRTIVPAGASNVVLTVCIGVPGGSGTGTKVELLVAGRKWKTSTSSGAASNADTNTTGENRWNDVGDYTSAGGGKWRGFISATQASNEINIANEGDRIYVQSSRSLPLTSLVNTEGSSASVAAGDVLDIAIARNRSEGTQYLAGGNTRDTASSGVALFWVKVEFTT